MSNYPMGIVTHFAYVHLVPSAFKCQSAPYFDSSAIKLTKCLDIKGGERERGRWHGSERHGNKARSNTYLPA